MIKSLILKYWDSGIGLLHHRSAFAVWFVVATMFATGSIYTFFYVDSPFDSDNKTTFQKILHRDYENWRLHALAFDIIVAKDEKDILRDDCNEIQRQIRALRLARWQIMGVSGMSKEKKDIELDMANTEIDDAKKKLRVAELALTTATHSYELLIAQR